MPRSMKCPHCGIYAWMDFEDFEPRYVYTRDKSSLRVTLEYGHCPSDQCNRLIVRATRVKNNSVVSVEYVIPPANTRQFPEEFLPNIMSQYEKARKILPIDPNMCAAASRRCLQMLLREFFHVKEGSLYNEMQQLLDSNQLPAHLARDLDRVREIGNLGAHPAKGDLEIPADASEEEAEWSLEILEDLFEHITGREKSRLRNERFDRDHPRKKEKKANKAIGRQTRGAPL